MMPNVSDLGLPLLKVLAVIGGLAAGAFGTGWIVQLICKLTVRRKPPSSVLRVLRGLGGLTLGVAVWLWVFGPGGGGFGGSGFGLFGGGSGKGNGSETEGDGSSEKKGPQPGKEHAENRDVLRIVMLGGDRVAAGRFYVIEGEKQPRTLDEIEQAIKQRRPPVQGIEIVIYLNSVADASPAVTRLDRRAKDLGLTVNISKRGTDAPP